MLYIILLVVMFMMFFYTKLEMPGSNVSSGIIVIRKGQAAGFVAGNWKCKSEVVHGVLQFESGCLVLECLLTL
jgi:hypothetical protein